MILKIGLFILASLLSFYNQGASNVDDLIPQVSYTFGQSLTFELQFSEDSQVKEVFVFWQADGSESANQGRAQLSGNQAVYQADLTEEPLPPFVKVTYWFGITSGSGANEDLVYSQPYTFDYEDDRFSWKRLESDQILLNWIEGDAGFAQQAVNAANEGLQKANAMLPFLPDLSEPVHIYLYPTPGDVQEALQLTGISWLAGHANPELNLILTSISPGSAQLSEIRRQIPHEIMHILLHQYVTEAGQTYGNLPLWLSEGLASLAELEPNSDYPILIYEAWQSDNLLGMAELCRTFPSDPSRLILAYAQSTAFTNYLLQQYGASGMDRLILNYTDGLECERGAEQALGDNLTRLDQQWVNTTLGELEAPAEPELAYSWLILVGFLVIIPLLAAIFRPRPRDK